jgi:hypothetical protein
MHVRWRIFNAPKRKSLDSAVMGHHHAVHRMLLIEAFGVQIVHGIIGEILSGVAHCALPFPEEDLLSM